MAGEKKSGYHPGGRVIRPTRKKATTRVKHSGQGIGGRGGLPSLKAPSRPRATPRRRVTGRANPNLTGGTPARIGAKHSGQGRGGRGGIPDVKAPSRPRATPRRRAGLTGKANTNPNLSATQKAADSFNKRRAQAKTRELLSKRMPTQARPARRSTRGSTPRSNPMSRFRQAGRRAMSRFNRRR